MSAQPSIREEAVRTALAFLMAESKRGHSTTRRQSDMKLVMRLRDSLIYRAESVLWHPQLVEDAKGRTRLDRSGYLAAASPASCRIVYASCYVLSSIQP